MKKIKAVNELIAEAIPNRFFYTKVVSRNIISDWIQSIRNMLGLELKGYSNMIKAGADEILLNIKDKKTKWYRLDIEQLGNNGVMINLYGELE